MIFDTASLFAMAAAFSFACADMAMRSGLQHTDPFVGSTISCSVGVLTLLALILLSGVRFPPYGEHYLWLAAAGIFDPGWRRIDALWPIAAAGLSGLGAVL